MSAANLKQAEMEALAEAQRPIAPSPQVAARMRERILARARATFAPHKTVRQGDGQWEAVTPLVDAKLLFRDEVSETLLYRLLPGAELPGHAHPGNEECMMLEGEMWIGELCLLAGDFHLGKQGHDHDTIRSPKGALLYVRRAFEPGSVRP